MLKEVFIEFHASICLLIMMMSLVIFFDSNFMAHSRNDYLFGGYQTIKFINDEFDKQ